MSDELAIHDEVGASAIAPPPDSTPVEVGYCLRCGYDMRGLGVEICPECGSRFDADEAKAFMVKWAWDLRQRLRIANVVSAVGILIGLLYLLTRTQQVFFAALALIGIAFLLYYVSGLVFSLYCLLGRPTDSIQSDSDKRNARIGLRHCSMAGLIVLGIIGSALLMMAGEFIGAFAPGAIGFCLMVWQIRIYVSGRDRGFLLCLPESFAESIQFGIGISKFFALATFMVLAALLAVR